MIFLPHMPSSVTDRRQRTARRGWRHLILIVVLGLSGCTSVFLQPDHVRYFAGRAPDTPVHDVRITAPDGTALHAQYLPAQAPLRGTVLFLHGNAENLSSHIHMVTWLPAAGYAVLALDYRGYGESAGSAGIDGVHQDAAAALAWLVARGTAETGPLIVYGQSLGASVAIYLVATSPLRTHVSALIADSAFSSYRRIAREKLDAFWLSWPLQWPLSWLISDRYAAIDVVARISPIPLLLLQGDADAVVDVSHARRLYEAAHEPRQLWIVPGGHHIDAVRRPQIRERLIDYLDQLPEAH
jgi:fermentation-respiration switch protein FrsA (DUF1100 family)